MEHECNNKLVITKKNSKMEFSQSFNKILQFKNPKCEYLYFSNIIENQMK